MENTPKRENKVLVFSTPHCPFCTLTKRYLEQLKVPFVEKDVSKDAAAARDMIARSKQNGTPVIDINGNIVLGFDVPRLNYFLGIPMPQTHTSTPAQQS